MFNLSPFECGLSFLNLDYDIGREVYGFGFFFITFIFVIFDVEVIFFFPVILCFCGLGFFGFCSFFIFFFFLLFGLFFEYKKDVFFF
jgi:NADH-quinone oxidoreductase subunit A